jgi:hypothetical protein
MSACPQCSGRSVIWGHRGSVERHAWEDGEATCCCQPRLVCAVCELGLLRDNGLVLLDNDCWAEGRPRHLN